MPATAPWTLAPVCATIDSLSASILGPQVNLHEIRVFLTVADELHFGRAAERLYLSQPQVSRIVATLEQRIGGALFHRTSRSVELTALGARFRNRVIPAVQQVEAAYDEARAAARGIIGQLDVGCIATTSGQALTRLLDRFRVQYPDSSVVLRELPLTAPYESLEADEVGVLVIWQTGDSEHLTFGPVLERRARVVAVAADHPLATRRAVSIEEVAEFAVPDWQAPPVSSRLLEAVSPRQTPSGRPIRRAGPPCRTLGEALDLVARSEVVHTTVDSLAATQQHRSDLVFVPVTDLPPLPSGLVWRTGNETARIRALAEVARALGESALPT